MPATDLRFSAPQPASLDLRFGAAAGGGADYIDLTLAAALPSSPITASLPLDHDNAVNRSPKLWSATAWHNAAPRAARAAAPHGHARPASAALVTPLPPAAPLPVLRAAVWNKLASHAARPAVGWLAARATAAVNGVLWANLETRLRPGLRAIFAGAAPLATAAESPWISLLRHRRPAPILPWGVARPLARAPRFDHAVAARHNRTTILPWGEGGHPGPGRSPCPDIVTPSNPPCYVPAVGPVALRFRDRQPASLDLLFKCPGADGPAATIVIPVRRVYMQTNTVTLVLAETGQPIPARQLRLALDVDSWSWGWSARIPASYLAVLQAPFGDLVEVIATINGTAFRLAVERIQRDRSFGAAQLAVSGRGRAAWLADPYADIVSRSNSGPMTAQQLMADALTENGVSNGWSIDWQITDWAVPAGAWQHTGTALEACRAIADAAGAYLQPHPTDQILRVLPRYPTTPWNWSGLTPDIDLPDAACEVEGIEWQDKPAYNTVFVAGQVGGILGHVTRQGTAGDKAAPMISDALITHADAARQRGTAILSDTGRQKHVTINLQVMPETGIIVPGRLLRYTASGTPHLGLTRSVEISYDFPKLRQSITVESHDL